MIRKMVYRVSLWLVYAAITFMLISQVAYTGQLLRLYFNSKFGG